MKLKPLKKNVIYILCPANIDTGGPTDLHQLAYVLKNKYKKNVKMYYYPTLNKNPTHKNYKLFKIPFVKEVKDNKYNILIVPETFHLIQHSKKFKNVQKYLWWLSVDNFLKHWFVNKNNKISQLLVKIPHKLYVFFSIILSFKIQNLTFFKYLKIIYFNLHFSNIFKIDNISLNLVHSKYQHDFLKLKKIKSFYLSDYIRDEYFRAYKKIKIKNKKNHICYNPSKCTIFFKRFMKLNPDLNFVPLKGLSLKAMMSTLSKSKIYMDFGFHPGQDHLPREAAILLNCIITNKEGSAAIYQDVPILEEFKFKEINYNFFNIRKKIDFIFEDFPSELNKFKYYRNYLFGQKKIFEKQIKKIFI